MSKPVKAVGKAVGSVFKAVGRVVSGVVKAVGKVASAVINFVASPFMGLFGMPGMPNDQQEADRQTGVLIQQQGSTVNIPVVYGYRKVAGTVTYVETGSTKNKYMWVAYVFSEAQAAGIRRIFIDDVELEGNTAALLNTGYPVNITGGKYANRLVLQSWGGRPYFGSEYFDAGNASLMAEAPSWKSTHTYNGLVTVFARYEWKEERTQDGTDNNPYGGGIPQIHIELLGRTVASLVTEDSEDYDYGDWTGGYTERYSTNPAEILLDYLRNPDYGKGLANSEIDWDSFRTAAAKYNQTVEYVPGKSGPFLTTNYVLDTSQTIFSNVKALLTNMRAYLPYVDGKYKLVVEDAGNPTDVTSPTAIISRSFTKDNIVDSIVYTGIEKSAKYNTVVVKYVDPGDKWNIAEAVFPGTESARQQLIAQDGGRENKFEITMGGITNWVMAYMMARTILLKSRYQDSCTLTVTSEAFDLEPGDNVYINGNILKFGDANSINEPFPWRIVSKKLNNDYTFELGCVRNPDFIYPFVTQGPRDEVLPPYIPKGAEIEYVGSGREYGVGLEPPTRIRKNVNYDSDPTGITIGTPIGFPDPDDPTGVDGGGVGAPDSPINVNPPNDDPPQITPLKPLEDFIRIDRAEFTVENNFVYAVLTFLQPGHPMYSGLDLYYKRDFSTEIVWTYVDVVDVPGEGNPIRIKIGPLLQGQNYVVNTNVRYSNGENSTFIGTARLQNVGSELVTNPQDFATKVGTGWTLPTDQGDLRRDTLVSKIVGEPLLTGGEPRDPREMQWTFTQDINRRGYNGSTTGINIYWKASTATYWNKNTVQFPANYVAGSPTTFTLPFTLGQAGTSQQYDFVVRFIYTDQTESTRQYRVMGVRVETDPFGSYAFDPFYGTIPAASGDEDVSSYELITVDNAPPGAVVDPRELQITFNTSLSLASTQSESIVFYLNTVTDPDKAWVGVRMYYRPVVSGENPDYQTVNFFPVTKDASGRLTFSQNIQYDTEYEYVLVPVVFYNNVKVEANSAWYGKGAIHNRLENGRVPNFFELLNFQLIDTDVALHRIKTVFPQTDPTVQIQRWRLIQTNPSVPDSNTTYYQLQFYHQHIEAYSSIDIYRRNKNLLIRPTALNAPYYGTGRWEKMTVTDTNTDPNGVVTVNLRPPIDFTEFKSESTGIDTGDPTTLLYSLYANSNAKPLSRNYAYDEFLIVVTYLESEGLGLPAPVESTKGTLLRGISTQRYQNYVDGLEGRPPPETVEITSYNTYDADYLRNLTEAATPAANSVIWIKERYGVGNYSPPSVTPTII